MNTKHCKRCDTEKSVSEFSKHKAKKDGLQASCKACVKGMNRAYYLKTPEKNPDRVASKVRMVEAAKEYIWGFLCESSCIDCGENDPVVLEFDHVRGTKRKDVSRMVSDGLSLLTIQEEIAKCDIRCANCHRRVTYERMGSYRSLRAISSVG